MCGLNLTGRSNVTIKNVLAKWWDYDFYLINSCNNTITGNTGSSYNSFYLINSCNNTITGNIVTAYYYSLGGFFLSDSSNNSLSGNVMVRSGLFMSGSLASLTSNVVDQSNTVNGRVLYYYVSESGLSSANFTNAGQVILVNCSDSEISDLSISNTYAGIEVYYSSNITISRNSISSNNYGIYLSNSNNNTLIGNTANNNANQNGLGFYLDSSSYNTLSNNTAKNNGCGGFLLEDSNYNNLTGNTATNNGWYYTALNAGFGFQLSGSLYNNLSGNIAEYNYKGFVLRSSSHNIVTGNTIVNFWVGDLDIDMSSVNNTVENNTIISMASSLLRALVYGECVSFYFYQQNIPSASFSDSRFIGCGGYGCFSMLSGCL